VTLRKALVIQDSSPVESLALLKRRRMSSGKDVAPAITCAENIALLHFLHEIPVQPSAENVDQLLEDDRRTIPLKQESRLAGMLATLSAIREDVDRVSAVAVRELPQHRSLEILVAVNKSRPSEGNKYLEDIGKAFHRVFDVLLRVTNREKDRLLFVVLRCRG
jgi:hypothetical protein